jgi:hypothetical protein
MTGQKELVHSVAFSELVVRPPMAEDIDKQPEYRLLWAILQEGIETYMKYASASSRRGGRLFHEAQEWIMQDEPTWLCSFVSICHVFDLDPEYIRSGLKHWRARQFSPTLKKAA